MTNKQHRANARQMLGGRIFDNRWLLTIVAGIIVSAIVSIATTITFGIAALILTGPLSYGLATIYLSLARGGDKVELSDCFKGFSDDFGGTALLGFLTALFTSLWSLLFVIPGIVKTYSYSMAMFIKKDHPEYTATQCITESRKLMNGNKWKLFCLDLSFIGWNIVGSLCCGVGTLWVLSYNIAAHASFYESIKPANENMFAEDVVAAE